MSLATYGYQHQLYDGNQQLVRHAMSLAPSDPAPTGVEMASKSSNPAGDPKPRLTKEQHVILERHFRTEYKPTTNTKKHIAEKLGVSLDKNRRAKTKHDGKKFQKFYDTLGIAGPKSAVYQQAPFSPTLRDPVFLEHIQCTMAERRRQQLLEEARTAGLVQNHTSRLNINALQPSTTRNVPLGGYTNGEVSDTPSPTSQYDNSQIHQPPLGAYHYRPNPTTPVSHGPGSAADLTVNSSGNQPMVTSDHVPLGGYIIGEVDDAASPTSQYNNFQHHQSPQYNNFQLHQPPLGAYNYRPNPSTPVSQGPGSTVDPIVNSSGDQSLATSDPLVSTSTPTIGRPFDSGQPHWYAGDEADAMPNTAISLTSGGHWPHGDNAANFWGVPDGQPVYTITNTSRTQQPHSMCMQSQHPASLQLTEPQPSFTDFQDPAVASDRLDAGMRNCPMDDPFVFHGQAAQSEYVQQVPGISVAPQLSVAAMDSCRQDNSRAVALADSSGATEIPPLPSRHAPAFRLPRTNSSIAARRHQRPKALSGAAFRSATYAGHVPPSPSTIAYHPRSDQTLRRIKSTGIPGVGRIQKPNKSSAQHSPLNGSYLGATTPPQRFPRQELNGLASTTVSIPLSSAPLAPPTPISPFDTALDSRYPNAGSSERRQEFDQPGFNWNHALGNMASPPMTPLDVDQAMQIALHHPSLIDAQLIHSAPPWLQSFNVSPPEAYGGLQHVVGMPQVSADQNTSQTYGAPMDGPAMPTRQIPMRTVTPSQGPSLHDVGARYYHAFQSTGYNLQAGDVAHQYHGLPFQQAQPGGGRLYQQGYPMPSQLATPPTQQFQNLPASASNLLVHEWSPPEGSPPLPRQMQGQPQTYTWSTIIGPEAYSTP